MGGAGTFARGQGRALGGPPLGRAGYAGGWSVDSSRAKRSGTTPTLLKAALAYARRGVPVLPCEPGGKRPLTYNGFWDASADPRHVAAWWDRWPDANLGVPTGERSGLLVLDIDPGAGGPESLAALERAHGAFPKTAKTRTGGGGVHIFFVYPATQEVRNSAGKLGPGLDVRGEGGYVIVPPSRTRGVYEWLDRTPLAQPSWLLECLRERSIGSGEERLF